jgi:hypothetical protein
VITRTILPLLLALLLPVLLFSRGARADCQVETKATVPLQVAGGRITLPVQANGMTGTFVLDTGAARSLVTAESAQRLGLARDQWVGTTMGGIGGIDTQPNADPRSLSLGGVSLTRRTLNHDHSLTVGVLPGFRGTAIDGLLGRDYLSLFDLDLDLPNHRLTLYQVSGCSGRFLPWLGNYASIPMETLAEAALTGQVIMLPVTIDGRSLRAMLDSGASASLVALPGMYKLGLDQTSLAGDPSDQIYGEGSRVVTVHRHRFGSLTVGNQTIASPVLWVEPIRVSPIIDMLLGADWLAGRRIWISFTTKQLFLAE